jgi:uncharacterized repeat protein (TIGR01451 family)
MASIIITAGMAGWFLVLDNLRSLAAPPAQEPITTLGINHQCNDPFFQEDPLNDTYEAATVLVPGQSQIHTLDSGGDSGTYDKDWFVFTVPAGQALTLSITIPPASALTMTQISLFTSTDTAQSDYPAATSLSGELGWTAQTSPVTQSLWARVRNRFSADQDDTNNFCDVIYNIKLRHPGDLDNPDTLKSVQLGTNRTLTYTIMLRNTGEMLAPVTVTDTLPAGANLRTVTISPTSATTMLLTNSTTLTWIGQVTAYGTVKFTVTATATEGTGSLQNTAWILANKIITRTSEDINFGPELPEGIFLPIIFKK